jgi:protein-L-isoaspartate O-methyltransferase
LRLAQYETDRGLSYSAQLQRKGRPFDENDLKNIALPSQVTWASRFSDAAKAIEKLKPIGNGRLIAALKKMGARPERFAMRAEDAAITRKANDVLKGTRDSHILADPVESIARLDRLARMGITDTATLREAARELLPFMAAKAEESAVKKAERAIIGQKVGIDFFPTPAHVAQRMASLAHISEGMRVLEPSAGNGNLADAAKSAGGVVDVIEISSQLRDILTAKGYTVVDHDFEGFTPEQPYQAILMNPPFSQRRDAAHIMRAFGMLASGGYLVAIAGEGVFIGTDQKAVAFRAWLDTHNATVESLDGGTFKDKDLLAQTGANARLIVIKK